MNLERITRIAQNAALDIIAEIQGKTREDVVKELPPDATRQIGAAIAEAVIGSINERPNAEV